MRLILLVLVVFLLTLSLASALNISTYKIDAVVYDKQILVDTTLEFQENLTGNFIISLPNDAKGISLYIDGDLVKGEELSSKLKIVLDNVSVLRYNYVTSALFDKEGFFYYRESPHDVDSFELRLTLDEGIVLQNVKDQEQKAVYPKPVLIGSDGRLIYIDWVIKDVKEGETVAVFAKLKQTKPFLIWPYLAILTLLIIILLVYINLRKPKKVYVGPRTVKEPVEVISFKPQNKDVTYEKHLKEDEEQVVNVLKLKEGSCEQGTLVIATGFSKATLSRILMELEERKVIVKEKRGKKNLIHLKEAF